MNLEAVQKHCMEIYESALVWIPKNSLIRKTYTADVSRVPKVILGLSDSWGPAELIMQNGSMVESVAFSSTLQCPPYSCWNPVIPVESSGIQWSPVESSGMGPDSSGFHRIAD